MQRYFINNVWQVLHNSKNKHTDNQCNAKSIPTHKLKNYPSPPSESPSSSKPRCFHRPGTRGWRAFGLQWAARLRRQSDSYRRFQASSKGGGGVARGASSSGASSGALRAHLDLVDRVRRAAARVAEDRDGATMRGRPSDHTKGPNVWKGRKLKASMKIHDNVLKSVVFMKLQPCEGKVIVRILQNSSNNN